MYSAIVLINVERKQVKKVAEQLIVLDGVKEIFSTAGEYDLVAVVSAEDKSEFSELITDKIVHCEAIHHAKTLFALDQYK